MRIFEIARTQRAPRIRLVNLVDILFILLIFFIATTTFRSELPAVIRMTLPEARTAEELGAQKTERLLVSVGPDETIYLDGRPVTLEALERALREAREKNPEVVLQFSADKSVSYGTVVAVVDAASAAGIRNIMAFTKKTVQQP
jgi:biopolymer transport protein ExbD